MPEETDLPPSAPVSTTPSVAGFAPVDTTPTQQHYSGGSFISMLLLLFLALGVGGAAGWFLRDWQSQTIVQPTVETQPPVTTDERTTISIGGIMPITGDAATYGIPYQKTAQLAEKEINQAGGVHGKPIEIIWEDGQCETEPARLASETLIKEKNVQFLIAGACSGEYLGAGPIASANRVISFSPSATSPKISEIGRYIFRIASSDALAGRVAAEYVSTKWQAKTAGIISENSEYALGLAGVFEKEFQTLGGQVIFSEVYETGTTDFSTIIKKARANPPEVVYILPQTPTPGVLVVSALKQAGIASKLLTAEVLLQRDVIQKQGKLLEGVTGIEIVFDDQRPKTQAFFDAYQTEYGLEVNDPAYMAAMYDILYLIKEAYERSGGDTEKIADYLYGLKHWEGAVGVVSFDAHGDPSFPYSIRLIQAGEAVQIDTFTPS